MCFVCKRRGRFRVVRFANARAEGLEDFFLLFLGGDGSNKRFRQF